MKALYKEKSTAKYSAFILEQDIFESEL